MIKVTYKLIDDPTYSIKTIEFKGNSDYYRWKRENKNVRIISVDYMGANVYTALYGSGHRSN